MATRKTIKKAPAKPAEWVNPPPPPAPSPDPVVYRDTLVLDWLIGKLVENGGAYANLGNAAQARR